MKCSSYSMIDRAIKITYVEELKQKVISFSVKGRKIQGVRRMGMGPRCPLHAVRLRVAWGAWGHGPPGPEPTPRSPLSCAPGGGRRQRGQEDRRDSEITDLIRSKLRAKTQTWPELHRSFPNGSPVLKNIFPLSLHSTVRGSVSS